VPALPVDPWVVCANTPDWQHLKAVHRLQFDHEWSFDEIGWTDHSIEYDLDARFDRTDGPPRTARVGVYCAGLFRLHGETMGHRIVALTDFQLRALGPA